MLCLTDICKYVQRWIKYESVFCFALFEPYMTVSSVCIDVLNVVNELCILFYLE